MHQLKIRLAAVTFSMTSMMLAACGSQPLSDEETQARPSCPRDMRMECFERWGQTTKCRCVTPGELEQTLEDLTRLGIP